MDVALDASQLASRRVISYVNAGSLCILFYDFFLTLDSEITTIWANPRWNYTKIFYVLTRYSTLIEAGIIIYQQSIPGNWYGACAVAYKANAMLFVFGMGTGEIIMTIRTWAVWGMGRTLAYILSIFYLATWAGGFFATVRFVTSIKFVPSPFAAYTSCYPSYADPIIVISWVLLLIYDAVMLVMIIIPTLKAHRDGDIPRFAQTVYNDGMTYYFYLFTFSLINILLTVFAPRDLAFIFFVLSRVLHALLSCRVVLHIAEHARDLRNPHLISIAT